MEGGIFLDGADLRDYDVADLRKEIGVTFQDYVRYDMAVADNTRFGRIEDQGDRPRIERAAQKSQAEPVILGLPDGCRQILAVLISDRFSTVRLADRILMLENGQILEQASHQHWPGGRYAELFELQAAGCR